MKDLEGNLMQKLLLNPFLNLVAGITVAWGGWLIFWLESRGLEKGEIILSVIGYVIVLLMAGLWYRQQIRKIQKGKILLKPDDRILSEVMRKIWGGEYLPFKEKRPRFPKWAKRKGIVKAHNKKFLFFADKKWKVIAIVDLEGELHSLNLENLGIYKSINELLKNAEGPVILKIGGERW